jgi:hypothetical protein
MEHPWFLCHCRRHRVPMNALSPVDVGRAMRPLPFQLRRLDQTLVNEVSTPTFLPKYWSGQNQTNWTGCAGPGLPAAAAMSGELHNAQ